MIAWMRQHRRLSIGGAILLALIIIAAASSTTKKKSAEASTQAGAASTKQAAPTTSPAVVHHKAARHASGRHKPKPPVRATSCHAPGDVLAGVYHPYRLHVLAACTRASGTVMTVRHEEDGDLHIDLVLDPASAGLLNDVNRSAQRGALVVEFMARDGAHLPAPSVGDHLTLSGAWVNDADHGWNEIHPVWSEQINSGSIARSGPQYGGSAANDSSSNAQADCSTATGQQCQGYDPPATTPSSTGCSSCGIAPSGTAGASGGSTGSANYRAGELCTPAKESSYEGAGYTCSPGSDGRERLHRR
jgi:hypothetical protein